MNMVDIPLNSTAAALAALYNASQPQGMGILHYTPEDMTEAEAAEILSKSDDKYADYIKGRIIKTDFSGGQTSLRLFDRDIGDGAGYKALVAAGVISSVEQ